jgi:hypothetical protein
MSDAITRSRLPCQACGTWTCPDCGWKRHGASLAVFQDCPRCGGGSNEDSAFTPARHQAPGIWEDHNPAAGPQCLAWAEYNPAVLDECRHESCQVTAWGHVIRRMRT